MISPVRSRAKASGLTRISVRSTDTSFRSGGRRLLGSGLLGRALAPAARATRNGRGDADLRLAERAYLPRRIERTATGLAGILQLAHAVRAAKVVLLDLIVAVGAEVIAELRQTRLRRLHLELALPNVVQILGWPDDHVDDRPDERKQRRQGRAADQQRVGDPAPGVGKGPVDESQPDHDQEQDHQLNGEVQRAVVDPEDGTSQHSIGECNGSRGRIALQRSARALEKGTPEQVADPEEDQDHHGDDHDHRQEAGLVLAIIHRIEARSTPRGASRSATRYSDPVASTTPSGPASSRARTSAVRGSRTSTEAGPPSWRASDWSVGGGNAREF